MYANEDGLCSIYSLVLYLNSDFEGGELELQGPSGLNPNRHVLKPSIGSAVLFPHDMLHAGLPVTSGRKYIARSELMFRCVEAARPPRTPALVSDPLYQKMATLYAHVGDLVTSG